MDIRKLLTILVVSLFLISSVSAFDLNPFANKKIWEKEKKTDLPDFLKEEFNEKYGTIRISKTFLWIESDKIAEYSLETNTEQCLINCEAKGRAILYSDGFLFDALTFKDWKNLNKDIPFTLKIKVIETHDFSVPDKYKTVCNKVEKGKDFCFEEVDTYKIEKKQVEVWKEYDGGQLPAGQYEWRLEASKKPDQKIDFIPTAQGEELSEWAWWNADWDFKKPIHVNTSTINIANYTLFINVTYDANMNTNFGDLRFTNQAEDTELNYWFYGDSYIASNSVMVAVFIGNLQNQTIWMYYGNSEATNNSNIDNAFFMGDNFNTAALNATKWETSGVTNTFANSVLKMTGVSGNGYVRTKAGVLSTASYGWEFTALQNWTADGEDYHGHTFWKTAFGMPFCGIYSGPEAGGKTYACYKTGYATVARTSTYTTANIIASVRYNSTSTNFYEDNIYKAVLTTQQITTSDVELGTLYISDAGQSHNIYWAFIRPISNIEPVTTFGTEQTNGISPTASLNSPPDLSVFSTTSHLLNCTVEISAVRNMTASMFLDGSEVETNTEESLGFDITYLATLSEGVHSWYCFANNTDDGRTDTSTTWNLTIDLTPPEIEAYNITNLSTFTMPTSSLWFTDITDAAISDCWYHTSDNSTNVSIACSGNQTFNVDYTDNLVAWWNFSDGSGSTLTDITGNGHDGSISGASWVTSGSRYGLSFDGVNDYVNIPSSTSFNGEQVTMVAFVNVTHNSGHAQQSVIDRGHYGGTCNGYQLELIQDGFNMNWCDGSSNAYTDNNGSNFTAEQEFIGTSRIAMLASTYNFTSGEVSLYLDGVKIPHFYGAAPSQAIIPSITVSNTKDIYLGRRTDAADLWLNGTIYEARLYNTTLTIDQINRIYDNYYQINVSADITTSWNTAGNKNIYVYANDSSGLTTSATYPLTVRYFNITQNSSDSVTEASLAEFTLLVNTPNLAIGDANANLTYNGVNMGYTDKDILSANSILFTKSFLIPEGLGNVTGIDYDWFWTYNTNFLPLTNTSTESQTVYSIAFDNCTDYTDIIANFTLRDELTRELINASAGSQIKVDLTVSSKQNTSVSVFFSSIWTNVDTALICVPEGILNDSEYRIDIIAEYSATDKVVEFFYLDNGTLSSSDYFDAYTERNIDLYELAVADSTTFLFTYFDESTLTVPNAIVHVYRKYIGEDLSDTNFIEVERAKQDDTGATHIHVVEEDVVYYFRVTQNGESLYTSSTFNAKCLAEPCQITLQSATNPTVFSDDWFLFGEGGGYYTIVPNETDRSVSILYSLEEPALINLTVVKQDYTGSEIIIGSSAALSTGGVLSVDIPDSAGNNTYYAVVLKDGEYVSHEPLDLTISANVYYGVTGNVMASILVLALILMGATEGILLFIFIIIAIFLVIALAIMQLGKYAIIGFICAIVILIWKLATRGRRFE